MSRKIRFGCMIDFRNPPQWQRPWHDLYSEFLDLITWSETVGFDDVWMTEHHFAEDGYMPSPLVMATAIAARTKRIRIGTAIILLPLYHPVRLAEDCAVLDIISNGRLDLGIGLGYRAEEFDGYGIPLSGRGARSNEALQILSRLWAGETVTFSGKHFQIEGARIMPLPIQKPRPPIWVGGFNRQALRRAARLGDGMLGVADPEGTYKAYVEELRAAGKDPAQAKYGAGPLWLLVSNDPDKTFHEVAPHVLHQVNTYAKWLGSTSHQIIQPMDEALLKQSGTLKVLTPEDTISSIRKLADQVPLDCYYGMLPPAGYPAKKVAEHLELFASKVIPAFR